MSEKDFEFSDIDKYRRENDQIEDGNIDDIEGLRESYEQAKALYKELLKNLPLVANEMAKRGMQLVVNEINQNIDEKKAKISKIKKGVTDKVISTKNSAKNVVSTTKFKAKEKVASGRRSINEKVEDVKFRMEYEKSTKEELKGELDSLTNQRRQDIEDWKEEHFDRSKSINKVVEKVSLGGLKFKTFKQDANIRLLSLASKGARLIGKDKLADKLSEKAFNSLRDEMGEDTRVGRFARKLAENIYQKTDNVKSAIKTGKDSTQNIKENVVHGVKLGTLAIGKGVYKGAAFVKALEETAIEGVKNKTVEVGEKVSDKATNIKETVVDNATIGSNYTDMARKKVQLTRTNVKIGFKSFFKNMSQRVVDRLGESLSEDQERGAKLNRGIVQNRENIRDAKERKGGLEPPGPEEFEPDFV